jgi:cytochrome P450
MAATAPAPVTFSPWRRLYGDLREQHEIATSLPPGLTSFSMPRTQAILRDPLSIILPAYEQFGPVFTIKVLYASVVFALGPEANHEILVSKARSFHWREGGLRDLIPLLGDGLLTIDGSYHRQARRIMLPAFHRERLAHTVDTMVEETDAALASWTPGDRIDLYDWTRTLALRIALRALFGFDPDNMPSGTNLAHEFEIGLGYYGRDYVLQSLHGPGTPWNAMRRARERIDVILFAEITRRRAAAETGEDLLSLLLDAEDEDGLKLSDQEVRDQMMTLLFAGHDTTTATISFLFYELSRHPDVLARLREERGRVLGERAPTAADLAGDALPYLDMVLDETLRLYPPAWIGPRRAMEDVEVAGVRVPEGAQINYSSYASHRLPSVFEDPEAFVPERFAPERAAALPKGAYIPFGGGSRTCIGMRFGQLEMKAIALRILADFHLELPGAHRLEIRQTPTLGPKGGLPMTVRRPRAPLSATP